MANEVERDSLDLRYEGFRLKAPAVEERLLGSIAQRGIEAPLEGVEVQGRAVLLNGFKPVSLRPQAAPGHRAL